MALQVWLPLNGDFKNKGLKGDVTVSTVGTTTWNSDGKIGKCLSCNGSTFWNLNPVIIGDDASFCWWAKTTDSNGMFFIITANVYSSLNVWAYNGYLYLNTGDSTKNPFKSDDGSMIVSKVDDVWHHYVVTFDGSNCLLYIDGIYTGKAQTYKSPITNSNKTIRIAGGFNNAHSYDLTGLINDFRIYDHCLSAAEVKEISRGLVLHYKMNENCQTMNNCFNYPTFDNSAAAAGWNHWAPSGSSGGFSQNTDKEFIYNKNNTYSHKVWCNSGSYYICYQSPAFAGGYRSAQAIIKLEDKSVPDNSKVGIGFNANTGNGTLEYIPLGDDFYLMRRYGFSQDGTNDLVDLAVHPGVTVYISEFYLENDREVCSDFLNQNPTTIHDNSGYGNNGTITGELTMSGDSPRYINGTYFNGSSYIKTLPGELSWNNYSEITIAAWMKPTLKPSGYTGGIGIGHDGNFHYKAVSISNYGGKFTLNTTNGSSYVNSDSSYTCPLDEWHHYLVTLKDGTAKMYVDSNLIKTCTISYGTAENPQNPQIQVGVDLPGSDEIYTGYYSDVRIYTTALSEEDVKQLYEVSAKIDNLGNIHAYEFVDKSVGRELMVTDYRQPYIGTTPWNNFSDDGMEFDSANPSICTDFIEIDPSSNKYFYDFTVSISAGNQFYIGFERYDANKTGRSNNACIYALNTKPSTDIIKRRYSGVVNLSTDGTNPCKYIKLRVLNGWSGSTSTSTKLATIHSLSLREVPTSTTAKTRLLHNGIFETDLLVEGNSKAEIRKYLNTDSNEFIEI